MAGATYKYGPGSATLSTQPGEGFAGASGMESDDFADFVKQMVRRRLQAQRRPAGPTALPPTTIPTAQQPGGGLSAAPVARPTGRQPIWVKQMRPTGYIRLDRWEPGADVAGYE